MMMIIMMMIVMMMTYSNDDLTKACKIRNNFILANKKCCFYILDRLENQYDKY